jgi:hypothetical protein
MRLVTVSLNFGAPADGVDISASLTNKREHLLLTRRLHCCRAQRRTVCCYLTFVVRGSEDSRNSSLNAPSEWRQLSRPKKSVRVGGMTEIEAKAHGMNSVMAGHKLEMAST